MLLQKCENAQDIQESKSAESKNISKLEECENHIYIKHNKFGYQLQSFLFLYGYYGMTKVNFLWLHCGIIPILLTHFTTLPCR